MKKKIIVFLLGAVLVNSSAVTTFAAVKNSNTQGMVSQEKNKLKKPDLYIPDTRPGSNFEFTVIIPENSGAVRYQIIEQKLGNNPYKETIKTGSITESGDTFNINIKDKSAGNYIYTIYIYDENGNSKRADLGISVRDTGNLLTPMLSATINGNNGEYTIIASIPENSNAVKYALAENGLLVDSNLINDSTKTISFDMKKKDGRYLYVLNICDNQGRYTQDVIIVNVLNGHVSVE